jgi:cobalt/nickel transport system permease protein
LFIMLWAVHLSDGVLAWPCLAGGWLVAFALWAWASAHVSEDEIPRVGVMSAVFFVASLIRLPLGPASVHLILNGLIGLTLGRRAPLALGVGLLLQALLLGHGGYVVLGVNLTILALPALLARPVWRMLTVIMFRTSPLRGALVAGAIVGGLSVFLTASLNAGLLLIAGVVDFQSVAIGVLVAHAPIALAEAAIVGAVARFLVRARPEMLSRR